MARALINSPKILLADEPTGNLDTSNSQDIFALIREMVEEGIGAVVVTHDQELAQEYCHQLFYLEEGQLRENT